MTERNAVLRVAAIGDLHVKEDGVAPYRDLFTEISREADVSYWLALRILDDPQLQ